MDVVETLLEEELTDHLGFEKYDQKSKVIDNFRNGYTPNRIRPGRYDTGNGRVFMSV